MPKNLTRRVVDRNAGAIPTASNPVGKPAHRNTDKEATKQAAKPAENHAYTAEKHSSCQRFLFAFHLDDFREHKGQCRTNHSTDDEPDPRAAKDVAGNEAEHCAQQGHKWHREGHQFGPSYV